MEKRTKNGLIAFVVVTFLILLFTFGKPYKYEHPKPAAPAKTAAQIEQEDLVSKIGSGSVAWNQLEAEKNAAILKLQTATAAQEKQERITSGYRKVLCEKFDLVLSANGGLEAAANCGQYDTPVTFQ